MQKAKTFVSQRISTTHKALIWRPSRKKNSWTQRGTQTRKVTDCWWLQCTDPTHWPGLCPATVALLQASCALGVRAKALPRGHSSWRHPRSRRHPATPRRSSPVPRGIRSHLSARKPAFGRQRAWHHSLLQKNPHNLPPRNCQATNQASASTDAVQLLLQSGRVTEDAVLPPFTPLHRLTNVGNRETTWPPWDTCAATWHVRAVSRRSGFTFHSLYLSPNSCVEKGFGQYMPRFFNATKQTM